MLKVIEIANTNSTSATNLGAAMQLEPSELKAARDRLMRVQGQIGGIVKMIDEGRDCTELLNQLSAASTALSRAGFTIISSGMKACATAEDGDPQRKALEKAFMSLA
jgi:DNA-binding FrmR family transcriptional regulator